jgi:hypothetical protein
MLGEVAAAAGSSKIGDNGKDSTVLCQEKASSHEEKHNYKSGPGKER